MASFTTKSSKNKNLAVARLVSKKTGSTVSWVNLTETFSRAVFQCEAHLVTAKQMEEALPTLLGNDYVEIKVTDLTEELEAIAVTDF